MRERALAWSGLQEPGREMVPREGLTATLLRALVYALGGVAGLLPIATPAVAVSAGFGAALGALCGGLGGVRRLRLPALFGAALCVCGLAAGLAQWLVGSAAVVLEFGLVATLQWSFALQVFLSGLALGAFLRSATQRNGAFAALEVGLVALAGAGLVVAHRGGAINRPFELADAILAEGGDPTTAFLALGGVLVALFLVLLLAERRPLRSFFHLLFVAALFVLFSDQLQLPDPPPAPLLQPKDANKGRQSGNGQNEGAHGQPPNNSEELQFRDNYDSDNQQVPLAVVLLHDDFSPPSGMYYFRQAAFSQYNGRRLVHATRSDVDVDVAKGYPVARTDLAPVPNGYQEREPVDTTVALLSEHTRPFALAALQSLEPVQNPDPGRFRRVYQAKSMAFAAELGDLIGRPVGDPAWSSPISAHYLRMADDPRYTSLAAEIAGAIKPELRESPVAQALAVSLWLGREGTYSLRSGHADAEDPTADFLFGDRVGYCVHFAHAAVYLMRALGVPARVGAGYVVDEAARQGGSAILITGQNAHAWPEFYVQDVGWVIADVAPERALDPPPSPPDPDLQRLLGEMARGLRPVPTGDVESLQPAVRLAQQLLNALRWLVWLALPVTLGVLYSWKTLRRLAPHLAGSQSRLRLYHRAQLDRMAELALCRQYGESREAFARRVGTALPAFQRTTDLHLANTFGAHGPPSKDDISALEQHFRDELRSVAPVWRRILGWLDPLSFLRVR